MEKEAIKKKFIELGKKVTLFSSIGDLEKSQQTQIYNHLKNIAKCRTFNNEMSLKYGGDANWEYNYNNKSYWDYDVNKVVKNNSSCYILDGVPFGIACLVGTFHLKYTRTDEYVISDNILFKFLRMFNNSHPSGVRLKMTTSYKIEENSFKDKAKETMDAVIKVWENQHGTTSSFINSFHNYGNYQDIKKCGKSVENRDGTIEGYTTDYILFYKNLYVILTEQEVKDLLLELEKESMLFVSEELKRLKN